MSGFAPRASFGRIFNAAGTAGTRRLMVIGGLTVIVLGIVAAVALQSSSTAPSSTVAKAPKADPLPGGPHTNPAYSDLARASDQDKAAKAAAAGQSSVAAMPGSATAVAVPKPPPVALPIPAAPPAQTTRAVPNEPTAPPAAEPGRAVVIPASSTTPAAAPPTATQQRPDENQTKAYQAAISSLFAGWGTKAQLTEVILKPDDDQRAVGGGDSGARGAGRTQDTTAASYGGSASPQGPIPNARRRDAGQVLMPAGRGVYARTVLASSSDQGGPVVVEALSGPIAGNRMTGTFDRREDRLVVRLDSITLQDSTPQKIDALVIAPDTMETSVASSVDRHYLSRFVLPVAAAFVSGLGQAIGQSNSTVVASPFGGATAFQRLNLEQQLGVAAGAGAAQFGEIARESAPKGSTVKLDANVNVGVLFLAPLVVGGDR